MLSIDQPKQSHCLYAYVMWLGVKQSVFLWMKKTKLNESQNFLDVNDLHKGENGENRGKKLMYTKVQRSQKFDYNHFSKFKSWTNNKEKKNSLKCWEMTKSEFLSCNRLHHFRSKSFCLLWLSSKNRDLLYCIWKSVSF